MKREWEFTIRDIWDGIRTQPGRIGLALLAIAIGVSSLTILVAVLGGLKEKSRQIVQELGVNVIAILQQKRQNQYLNTGLEEKHASVLASNLPNCSVSTIRRYEAPTLGTNDTLTVVATDSSLVKIRQWQLQDGRFLDQGDIENRERSAVVSKSLSKLWNWKVGNIVMLRNTPFKIVGIVDVGGGALDTESGGSGLILGERVIFVPKTITPLWMTGNYRPGYFIDAIFISVPASQNFNIAFSKAQQLIYQTQNRAEHISWVTPESLIRGIKKLQDTIGITMGSIAILCLILGGTVLMSLMVANVRDRVTEIGLRRALGATQWDIAILFVIESSIVTGAAAVIGTIGTHLLLVLGKNALPVPLRLGLISILIPLLVSVILGIIFSYWPAKMAANTTPSEALRNE